MGEQVTLCHHHMTNHQKARHVKEIIYHTTTHPILYWTYYMNRIQIQVRQIILRWIHLNHQTTRIINEDDVWKIIKIDTGVKHVSTTKLKFHRAYIQDTYSHVQIKGNKVQIGKVLTTAPGIFPIFIEFTYIFLSQFTETYMLLMDFPSIRGE